MIGGDVLMLKNISHSVHYETDAFNIDDVINVLEAQKYLLEKGVEVVEALASGLVVDSIEIDVRSIRTDSKHFEVLVKIYEAYQDEIEDRIIQSVESTTGFDVPENLEPLVTLAVLALVLYGAGYAHKKVFGGKDSPSINESYNTTINNYGNMVGVSPESVESAIKNVVPGSKRIGLARRVSDIFRPAKRDGTRVKIGRDNGVAEQVIADFPSDAQMVQVADINKVPMEAAVIKIRATDRDSNKRGWAGQIENNPLYPKRMPMVLYQNIDADAVAAAEEITADIVIDVDIDATGAIRPKRIHVIKLTNEGLGNAES